MTVDDHVEAALASLAAVSIRELEATADVLGNRRHPLDQFAGVFRDAAISRELGKDPDLARFHVSQCVRVEGLVERLAGAKAPFWRHVREAALAYQGERA